MADQWKTFILVKTEDLQCYSLLEVFPIDFPDAMASRSHEFKMASRSHEFKMASRSYEFKIHLA
jgi:hypothetical protein